MSSEINDWIIVKGSHSVHCCFEYSIMKEGDNQAICECFNLHDAELILSLLNNGLEDKS